MTQPSMPRPASCRRPAVRLLLAAAAILYGARGARAVEGRTPLSEATTITTPGSYRVTSDITVSSGSVFTINCDNVNIDLDGHKLESTAASPVITSTAHTGLRVSHGIIIGGSKGISFTNPSPAPPNDIEIRNIQMVGQQVVGIEAAGSTMAGVVCVIENNTIDGTGPGAVPVLDDGIFVQEVTDSSITHNVVHGCELYDIHLKSGGNSKVLDNQASGAGIGSSGIGIFLEGTGNCFVIGNVCSQNRLNGIKITGNFCTVSRNTASASNAGATSDGIFIDGDANAVTFNTCSGNSGKGISAPAGSDNNTIDQNITAINLNCGIDSQGANNLVTENRLTGNGGGCTFNQEPNCRGGGPVVAVPGINAAASNVVCGNIGK